jgi:hypothetical protein
MTLEMLSDCVSHNSNRNAIVDSGVSLPTICSGKKILFTVNFLATKFSESLALANIGRKSLPLKR